MERSDVALLSSEVIRSACDHIGEARDQSLDRQWCEIQVEAAAMNLPHDEKAVEWLENAIGVYWDSLEDGT